MLLPLRRTLAPALAGVLTLSAVACAQESELGLGSNEAEQAAGPDDDGSSSDGDGGDAQDRAPEAGTIRLYTEVH